MDLLRMLACLGAVLLFILPAVGGAGLVSLVVLKLCGFAFSWWWLSAPVGWLLAWGGLMLWLRR